MNWFLYREDGHNDLNTRGWGDPIPTPPLEIQVLVRQRERIDAVLMAYARAARGGDEAYYLRRMDEYLSNKEPYSEDKL